MKHQTPTAAVIRHLLDNPQMPETVRQWMQDEADPEQRAMFFAVNLAEDFIASFRHAEDPRQPENALHNELMRMALDWVNWSRVAKVLLRRFTLPITLAIPVACGQCKPRWAWTAATWRGPVN